MQNDEHLLEILKGLVEKELSWGDSTKWVNQDFVSLSKKMNEKTGNSISSVTLKRLWGKVKYQGLPQTYTLNTLSMFAGYASWREFIAKNDTGASDVTVPPIRSSSAFRPSVKIQFLFFTLLIFAGISFGVFKLFTRKSLKNYAYAFKSHTTLNAGIPNSVVFDIDARGAPDDSVIIQQSWDTRLRHRISRNDRQATMIYYFPGYFNPKLIVNGKVVREHGLLVKSNGWITALLEKDVPVYFKKEDVFSNGQMSLPVKKIMSANIAMAPKTPVLSFCNVRDFGEIYTDDFNFETAVKNDFHGESSACQATNIYLLCKGTAVNIPLCARGCESALNFFFTSYKVSGRKKDLSAFGVDFNGFAKVKVQSKNGQAKVYVNDKLVYVVNKGIVRSQIIGIDIAFQGTGSVDYVRLNNKQVNYRDEF